MLSKSIDVFMPESVVAGELSKIQDKFSNVEIGSYPFNKEGKFGTSLVMRSADLQALDRCEHEITAMVKKLT
jgi:molybdopterin-biosynthesis enzyme MoeA-like protein